MKETILMALIVSFSMLAIPLSVFSGSKNDAIPTVNSNSDTIYNRYEQSIGFETIKVLKDGNVKEYSVSDYVFGVVAAEMPALYEKEALKAQAVAAYTFACYKINGNTGSEYDITSDGDTAQCFITREEAVERWGDNAQEYAQKIDECISAVEGEILVYDGVPIFAAYHAISSGGTNSCADVWGEDVPYLISVNSEGDKLAEGYLSEISFTVDEIAEKLKTVTSVSGEPENYFSDITATNNGYIKQLNYCGKTVAGSQIAELLGLRSSNFLIEFSDSTFTFTVKGYGHGVGMSQTGANYMAKQGSGYEEILLHYYVGATLQKK